ncbi:unnamed protein product [Sphagnum jensenii]|uniref:Uncharacterized protein n=1 Tax=Sphagnum jensenii TaxID=128206 RepID=A0ABP0VRY5_9BRYO
MAGAGRRMSGSFVSVARSVVRISTNSSSEVVAAGGKRGVGSWSMAPPAIPVAKPASFSCFCEMASVQSLLPLHSAIATSRMVTQLSTKAGTMLQNTLTHMSPDR